MKLAHDIVYGVKTFLPKTGETVDLLQRTLIDMAELPQMANEGNDRLARVGQELNETIRGRSVVWIVGTSLGFELVVLSFAALIFCRRDF